MKNTAQKLKEWNLDYQEVFWEDVRDEIYKLNPELAKICDQISPGKEHSLLKVRYPYGATIVDKGEFHLPSSDGSLLSLKSDHVPDFIKKKLSYCSIPLSLILHNDTEVFVEAHNRIISLNFLKSGDLFGVFESINYLADTPSDSTWSVSAGGRSVFMIPRITDKIGHNRIRKEFGIRTNDPPSDLSSQWEVFKGIYECSGGVDSWCNTILVFTDSWFSNNNDPEWLKFQKYLFKLCWSQLQLFKDAAEFSLLWSLFGDEISNRSLKPRPYLVDTLKHLVSIANGVGVAFKPAITETALPVSLIQDAYINCYNLKAYIPTLMQPCKLTGEDKQVYYSLTLPTVLESTPYVRNAPSIIEDERDIKRLMDTLIRTIKGNSTIINPIKHVKYDFFHSDIDQYGEILSSRTIAEEDKAFTFFGAKQFTERIFCGTSPFFRGCIRISVVS
ncbi:MAG: hypothetical protein K2X28_06110 [Alphaproteobacteria bacterium]|nr:hypothetical protein [Alphaproteobacteria bacterium]